MRPLSVLLASSLVLPAVVAGTIIWWTYEAALSRAHSDARHTVTVLREHALRVLETQETAIAWIDARIAGMGWDAIAESGEVHRLLKGIAVQSPHIDGLWLVRPDGQTVNSADFFPMPGSVVTEREYYQVLKDHDVTHLGRMIQGRLKGNLNFNISRRRTSPAGVFDGLVLVTISLSYFEEFWRDVVPDGSHSIGIIRADGEILARYPGLKELPPRIPEASPFFSIIRTQDVATYQQRSGADGRERIYGVARLGAYPAYIALGLDRAAVLSDWWWRSGLLLLLAAGTSAVLATAVRMAVRRERRLSAEIGRRKRAETTLTVKEEHLAALERAEAALRQSETRFRSLFETLTQGVVLLNAAGIVQAANAAAGEIFGVPAADLAGRGIDDPRWGFVDGAGQPLPVARFPAMAALRTGEVVEGVMMGGRNAARDERRWLVVDAIPQRRPGEEAPSGVFLLLIDVTERRRAEEAQELLVREVDHRAKNALAVVQAVVRLTDADTKEGFLDAIDGRISALARTHTLLARSRWEGADFGTLVDEELAVYRSAGRVRRGGPALVLSAGAAQAIGMVLHELATNAAKHGALSVPEGRVGVSWSVAADGSLTLTWEEAGGPPVAAPTRRGFGSRLVRGNVEAQLRGRAAFDWRAEGLRVTITLPAEHFKETQPAPAPGAAPGTAQAGARDGGRRLDGRRVLVVEDNAVVAMALVEALTRAGCAVVGPAATVDAALRIVREEAIDGACLDVDLQGQVVFPVAEVLAARNVPFVFCTGFGDLGLPSGRWAEVPLLRKPVSPQELAAALSRALGVPPVTAGADA
ncbi:HWE histidine kinase domain-containing protein [Azospirillum sp.]|uniref:HWE histidine kinase domain-containing protein n=1 Tax=Azospirillum sp. TaxID=34012 RepID=UPI002D62F584|nr:HWE histidine kinase domain-containing protein [Azospirillum sp.]HYD71223.1 HWE histidine kinase domain-containing protein [Azospirillum sp.]